MPRFSLSGFFGPFRCLIPTPGLTTEYPIYVVCVCVCVHTHIHPHTLPPTLKIENTRTTPLSLFLSKITPWPRSSAITEIYFRRFSREFLITMYTWWWSLLLLWKEVEFPWLRVYALKSYTGGLRSHHLLCCFERKNMLKEKTVSLKSHPTSQHIHTHVYFVHIYEYVYAEIWSIWILWALQVSHPDPWAHNRVPNLCSVCVCVYVHTHIHPHTLPPTSRIENTQTTPLSLFLSKIKPHAKQQVPS